MLEQQDACDVLEVTDGFSMCVNVLKVRLSVREQAKHMDTLYDICYGYIEFLRTEMQQIDFADNQQIQTSKKLINANSKIMNSWNKLSLIQQSKTVT